MDRALSSNRALCVWIPLFALRAEERRRSELVGKPTALLSAEDTRRLWQVSTHARHADVKAGMTVSQSIGLCPALALLEADPVHYDELFSKLVEALGHISPVVEPGELGRIYVGVDGLERLIGTPSQVMEAIDAALSDVWYEGGGKCKRRWRADRKQDDRRRSRTVEDGRGRSVPSDRREGVGSGGRPSGGAVERGGTVGLGGAVERDRREGSGAGWDRVVWRMGWARGKFPAWVAATRAKPGTPVMVCDDQLANFLLDQRIGALPLESDTHRRLWQLGLRTLNDLVALPEQAVASQFGREGRLAWRLASGMISEPVIGVDAPQLIRAVMHFPTPIADRGILANTIGKLVEQALRHPQRSGWRVRSVRVTAALEHNGSWMIHATLKDPSANRKHITTALVTKLDQTPPSSGIEQLGVEFTDFVRGTQELQLFARDAAAAARTGRRRALRWAAYEIKTRLNRSMLYHITEVHPWSRIPERRYALIDFDP